MSGKLSRKELVRNKKCFLHRRRLQSCLMKIIVATGILFNISRMWKDEVPEDDGDSEDGSENEDEESGNRSSSQASVTIEEGQVERYRIIPFIILSHTDPNCST